MKTRSPVRVLHVIDSFDLGGGQTALWNLVRALDPARWECEVATLHGRGVFWEQFAALGVPVHSLSPRKWLPLYIPALAALLARRRPQIVHCHLFGANWIAKPIAAACGVPVRISHDQCNDALRHDRPLALWLDRVTNRLSSHVCAVSRSTRDFLREHEGLAPERVSLVHNGVDTAHFSPTAVDRTAAREEWGIAANELLVIGVGRLHPQKNFALWLEVAAELPGARFLIAGTGPEESELRRRAQELGFAGRVRFAGHVAEPRRLYAAADVLLLTSRYEGTPLTVLEAMAMRLPVVASALDGTAEVIADGVSGCLAAAHERGEFVRKVARLLGDPALRASLGVAARERVRQSFSAEAMAAKVADIYERQLTRVNRS